MSIRVPSWHILISSGLIVVSTDLNTSDVTYAHIKMLTSLADIATSEDLGAGV